MRGGRVIAVEPRTRAVTAGLVLAAHMLAILLLFTGPPVISLVDDERRLATFDVAAPLPPPPLASSEPEGAAAPPARRATPRPLPAPEPIVPPQAATPTPPIAAEGPDLKAGATDDPGPGTGAGGEGAGTGSGGQGGGTGGGGIATRARHVSGRIVDADFPRAARRLRAEGVVVAAFTVEPDGRAIGCGIRRSSGNAALDATTCRLIEERFRFDPARDRDGRAVRDVAGWQQSWWLEGR